MARGEPVDVAVPGDKSITHRALILSSLATGQSRLSGLLDAADTRSTAAVLRHLGIDASSGQLDTATVVGAGLRGLRAPAEPLDCGNSGTTVRLMLGVLGASDLEAVLTGDESLRGRPMRRVTVPLERMGARFHELGEPDRLPIRVHGSSGLQPIDFASPRASAQVKTAILLAGLVSGARVRVTEPVLSRDHTERMLTAMGCTVRSESTLDGTAAVLEPAESLQPLELEVPADISSAAYFLALAALTGAAAGAASPEPPRIRTRGVGLNPGRNGILDVLERMGARVRVENETERAGEPVGDITVDAEGLAAVTVAADEVPAMIDEVPLLAAMAAVAEGESRFEGVAELRVKESDRVEAVSRNLRALGVETETGPDHLTVVGRPRPLKGVVESLGDHRIAMAFGVLGALAGNEIEIRGREATDISYPGFWRELDRAGRELHRT